MKAIVGTTYGSTDVLRLDEVDDPAPEAGRVVARVRAASVNAGDWHMMRGEPYLGRPLMGGLRGPKPPVRGWDFAGVVESVGEGVDGLRPGDEVFGTGRGTLAELVSAAAENVAAKPGALTFEEAAAFPTAAVTALQALRDRARVTPGQRILVNGAAGGVGTFTTQLAKAFGAHVTAVCSAANAELVTGLGADRVIDYAAVDFAREPDRYDAVLDNVGNRSLRDLRRVLTDQGALVLVGGGRGRFVSNLPRIVGMLFLNRFVGQRLLPFLAKPSRPELVALMELAEAGKVRAVIDRTYRLHDGAEAIRYLDGGHPRAKVVVVP